MTMLRRIPRILKFIPGTAQDIRNYFLVLQYWLAGSENNTRNLISMVVNNYASGEREALRGKLSEALPEEYYDVGIYHPRLATKMVDDVRDMVSIHSAAKDAVPQVTSRGRIGLLLMRAYVLAGNTQHYDAVIQELEALGYEVVPAFASGLDARPAIDRFFVKDGVTTVDAVLSLSGFSLVGGPAYNDAAAAEEVLSQLNVPYLAAMGLEFQTLESWQKSEQGLMPVESAMMVALPELDGAINPSIFGGRRESGESNQNDVDMFAHPERVTRLCNRLDKMVRLRKSSLSERRVAIVVFNFPPNSGATGTAAHLSVFESVFNTLTAMKQQGYRVDLPDCVDTLRKTLLEGNSEEHGTDANVAAFIPVDDHIRREPHLEEIEAAWGSAPGKQLANGQGIFVLGKSFGNVMVCVQPGFGYEGDPMRLLFEKGFAPTHAFSAFCRYLREDFNAHAVLHFGTHGALEFMPGKQSGLSAECWPDRLIGDMPNYYLYAANNASEGTIAKRRAGATLISYLTPPVTHAGLYKGLLDLNATIDRWENTEQALINTLAKLNESLQHDSEIPAVLRALNGDYIRPVVGGDLLRTPEIMPTGRNMHGFDPYRIPSVSAMRSGDIAASNLIERHMGEGHTYPQSIAVVLWGTDNIKTEGSPIAQVLSLMGAKPRFDHYGRLCGAELIDLETLGRPRIDVVVTLSGIFRDLLPQQTRMLAEAAWLAASASDESDDLNFVKKNAQQYMLEHDCDLETAALRVFSNADGAYGSNVNHLIDDGSWSDESELTDVFTSRKSFAYGRTGVTSQQSGLFENVLSKVELATQNLDSVEIGVTTVDHYFDTLGGISRCVESFNKSNQAPSVYISDDTIGKATVRTLSEQVALETRTRVLNPNWYEPMLEHGYEGVRHIEMHVTNTVGWSATTKQVQPWIYQQLTDTFMADEKMRDRLAALNPEASMRVVNRLVEAHERDYWQPDAKTLAALHAAGDAIEDRLEGIVEGVRA